MASTVATAAGEALENLMEASGDTTALASLVAATMVTATLRNLMAATVAAVATVATDSSMAASVVVTAAATAVAAAVFKRLEVATTSRSLTAYRKNIVPGRLSVSEMSTVTARADTVVTMVTAREVIMAAASPTSMDSKTHVESMD